jgi:hypothetical protein
MELIRHSLNVSPGSLEEAEAKREPDFELAGA